MQAHIRGQICGWEKFPSIQYFTINETIENTKAWWQPWLEEKYSVTGELCRSYLSIFQNKLLLSQVVEFQTIQKHESYYAWLSLFQLPWFVSPIRLRPWFIAYSTIFSLSRIAICMPITSLVCKTELAKPHLPSLWFYPKIVYWHAIPKEHNFCTFNLSSAHSKN